MRKIYLPAAAILFILLSTFTAQAQQRFALLVGIDKYYDAPQVLHNPVLDGCVNDVLAMKALLVKRFGYKQGDILMLLDDQATRPHVVQGLSAILQKCKAGDAVVFYFSGHGIWMNNEQQNVLETAVKDNMNQAMVMSNLYADKLDCLFPDALVKKIFNKFVDKKAIPTVIFDCCYSAKLGMMPFSDTLNPYDYETPVEDLEKSISFRDVFNSFYDYSKEKNAWVGSDTLNQVLLEKFASDDEMKTFNMKQAQTIRDSVYIIPPYKRPGSMFASLAASDENEKSLVVSDEAGLKHGAFTAALLYTLKNNPASMPLSDLKKAINLQVKQQYYPQTPEYYEDKSRLAKNLIGIDVPASNIRAICTGKEGNNIKLDAGLLDGLAAGNLLSGVSKKVTVKVVTVSKDGTSATVISGSFSQITKGDVFKLTDPYTVSAPLVKVFITDSKLSLPVFNSFVKEKVIPLTRLADYRDYRNWKNEDPSQNIFFNNSAFRSDKKAGEFLSGKTKGEFFVFLPIPSFITEPLKKKLEKNQNVQLVTTPETADLILYLNYTKPVKDQKDNFIFTWYNFHGSEINGQGELKFSANNVAVDALNADSPQLKILTDKISNLLVPYIRSKTRQWLNQWPAR